MQDGTYVGLDLVAIDRATDVVRQAVARGEILAAPALIFLLRRYIETGRDDLRDAVEPALARALEPGATGHDRAEWLTLFAEAARASADERLREAAADLTAALRQDWGRGVAVEEIAAAVDACLTASDLVDPQALVPAAIDELERVIGAAYRPGEGVARLLDDPHGERGRLADHVRAAAALLTAYAETGRLPYSMLAEELMQFARRTRWDPDRGGFCDDRPGAKPVALNCDAAQVLCRLARLHREEDYRRTAVFAGDADYRRDAGLTLAAVAAAAGQQPALAAAFGLALGQWLALSR